MPITKEEYKEELKKVFNTFLDEIDELQHPDLFHQKLDDFFGGCHYKSDVSFVPKTQEAMYKLGTRLGMDLKSPYPLGIKRNENFPDWMRPEMKALINELPNDGPAKNLKLELVRAFNKIVWDFYNNGWGNNWACPMFLLSLTECDDGNFPIEYSFGISYDGPKEPIEKSLRDLQDQILRIISDYPEYEDITGVDMWDPDSFRRVPNDGHYEYFFNPGFTDVVESFVDFDKEIVKKALEDNRNLLCSYSRDSWGYGNSDEIRECLNGMFEDDDEFVDWYMDFYNSLPQGNAVVS